ncbi:CDK-activating kinase assembly factor MAT1 [Neocloeon triangulifer]|uniref:CDK-activating kinase assembly factor MAT1 n=1 Tax=Neocloeon triangulifer TaxID=2078957 RepID=UPI00286F3DC2|nr:CDK-activating kinase assembly factor MAT1 [Neocloeon triangulifer]
MEEQACPRCKTTKYRNPSLKLMVNVCGHALCESCVDLLFLKGSGSCPDCGVPLRRSNFRVQIFEDPFVEKEMDVRRRVMKDYNLREEDFATLREYNDYLEELETIIYNLTNNIEIIATNQRIDKFKRDNKEIISRNRARTGREEMELEELLEEEKQVHENRKRAIVEEELQEKRKKMRNKEALIDELMFSEQSAASIVETFKKRKQEEEEEIEKIEVALPPVAATQFSTGIKFGQRVPKDGFLPVPKEDDTPLYKYEPLVIPRNGPVPPNWNELTEMKYIVHVREASKVEKAGGFLAQLACLRALEEAFDGLFASKKLVVGES